MTQANSDLVELGRRLMAENYPHVEISEMDVIQSGGIKTIWKLETSVGTVCLKRIRKDIPVVKFTTAAQAYLAGKGALVAGIIPTKDRELFFVHEGYGLVLYEWVDGSDLEMDKNPEHLYTGLKGLARFHQDSVGFIPPEDCKVYDRMGVWPDHYRKMREELAQWKKEAAAQPTEFHEEYLKAADDMIGLADQAIQLLDASSYAEWVSSIGPHGYMAHQDYGKGNALQTERGVYVLDLDNLAYDIPLRDVRKLIMKRMDNLERWDKDEIEYMVSCYESGLPLTEGQRRVLYIDLLFPHVFFGYVKSPFKKGERKKAGEVEKLQECYEFEMAKLPVLMRLLQIQSS